MRMASTGPFHAPIRSVCVAVAAIVAGPGVVVVMVVTRRMIDVVVVYPVVVDPHERGVPATPGPPENSVVDAIPQPVAVMADPVRFIGAAVWAPPVGMGSFEHAPMGRDVTDRVRVVVPVVRLGLV